MDIRLKIIDEVDKVGVREFAARLGVSVQIIYHWIKERGNIPSEANMQKLADYFGETLTVGRTYYPNRL